MNFDYPWALVLLLLLSLFPYLSRRSRLIVEDTAATFRGFAPQPRIQKARMALAALFLVAVILAAAQPLVTYAQGARFLFVVDVSRSMEARYSCSEPTFLERAKRVMRETVAALPEAQFGIVAFERFAFPITHMTADRVYLQDVIDNGLFVGLMLEATQTEIANALAVVNQKVLRLPATFGELSQVILISDGHVSGDYRRRLSQPLAELRESGIRVAAVGVGNPEPTPIVASDAGQCAGEVIEVNGERVLIPLRSDVLKFIATETGGSYFTEQETENLVGELRGALTPARQMRNGEGARRDIGALFIGLAMLAMLGFVYLPAAFPAGRDLER